ncbi:MAG: ATP-binding protein [Acidobacteria bacterium]|nr:ATP-binding protein [Acidobacteriota bacterium]
MGRPERPLDASNGLIAVFARDLRALRNRAGNPSYRELARTALFAPSVLSSAASGHRLPTLPVTLAFVTACGGDRATWERRWKDLAGKVGPTTESRAYRAPAVSPQVDTPFGAKRVPLIVSGPIGVGKTTFALRLADDLSAEFPDGQLYIDLGTCGPDDVSSNGIVRGFLHALGVPAHLVPEDPMQRIGLYRSLLAQRKVFVLLENVGDERQVRPLLGRAPHSQVVLTSRARLLGLDGTHRVNLDTFARKESMTLIGRLAGEDRVRVEYEATEALAELCGDLPLAINIIGRKMAARPQWAVAHTVGQLADRDRLMDSLSVGDVNVRERFASAYQLLSAAEKRAIHQLGRNGAGWTTATDLAALMRIAVGLADDLLEALLDAGLLRRADVSGRYCVPTLVSVFAANAQRDGMHAAGPAGEAQGVADSVRIFSA